MLLNHWHITRRAQDGMIHPFPPPPADAPDRISYGVDPHSYTFRLSSEGMRLLDCGRTLLDPKSLDASAWVSVPSTPQIDIQPGQMVYGWSVEGFALPCDVTGIVEPRSTYSRLGLVVLGGVVHAGWSGHILVEMLNQTSHPIRVYAEEGIATVLFLLGAPSAGYTGRYQGQGGAQ